MQKRYESAQKKLAKGKSLTNSEQEAVDQYITNPRGPFAKGGTVSRDAMQMAAAGYDPMSSTPDQFADFIKSEMVSWMKVIKDANIKAD